MTHRERQSQPGKYGDCGHYWVRTSDPSLVRRAGFSDVQSPYFVRVSGLSSERVARTYRVTAKRPRPVLEHRTGALTGNLP